MTEMKCRRCHRDPECALRAMAELTLHWVEQALAAGGNDWDLRHAVLDGEPQAVSPGVVLPVEALSRCRVRLARLSRYAAIGVPLPCTRAARSCFAHPDSPAGSLLFQ